MTCYVNDDIIRYRMPSITWLYIDVPSTRNFGGNQNVAKVNRNLEHDSYNQTVYSWHFMLDSANSVYAYSVGECHFGQPAYKGKGRNSMLSRSDAVVYGSSNNMGDYRA